MVKNEVEKETVVDRVLLLAHVFVWNGTEPRNPQSYPDETVTAESNSANTYSRFGSGNLEIFVFSTFLLSRLSRISTKFGLGDFFLRICLGIFFVRSL
jgi:hypothetical protein